MLDSRNQFNLYNFQDHKTPVFLAQKRPELFQTSQMESQVLESFSFKDCM